MRRFELTIRQKYIYNKTHLSLRISAVIGRYGPHLMIVMIFVTHNNFLNGAGIFTRPYPWILPSSRLLNE